MKNNNLANECPEVVKRRNRLIGGKEIEAFKQLVIDRHSANNSIEGIEITLQKLDEIFGLAKLALSAFNLQHPPRT